MYWALVILVGLLLLNIKEPFTINENVSFVDTIKDYSIRPVYKGVVWMIPYKHHYRKLNRYLT
jgi:hypothetical protein